MPSGKAHRKLATATAPLVVLGAWTISGFAFDFETWASIAIITGGYLMNPTILSPDCDLVHSDPSDKWGKLEPLLWGYQLLIHKGGGRNPFSHWPPLSSILRAAYIWLALFVAGTFGAGILDLIYWGLFKEILVSWEWIKAAFGYWLLIWTLPQVWKFIWGVVLGDVIHAGADWAFSYMRK